MRPSSNQELWEQMLMDAAPIVDRRITEIMYHRAAAAWGYGQTLLIENGLGEMVDLTKLFEQYRMLCILRGNVNEE